MKRVWTNLRSRVAVTVFGVALLPTLLLSWVNYRSTRDSLRATAEAALRAASLRAAGELDSFNDRTIDVVSTMARLPVLERFVAAGPSERAAMREDVRRILLAMRRIEEVYVDAVALVDTGGRVILDDRGESTTTPWALSEIHETHATGFATVSGVTWNPDRGAQIEAAAVVGQRGAPPALLVIRYKAAIVQAALTRQGSVDAPSAATWLNDELHIRLAGENVAVPLLTTPQKLSSALHDSLLVIGRLREAAPQMNITRAVRTPRMMPDGSAIFEFDETYGSDSTRTLIGATAPLRSHPWVVSNAMLLSDALAPARFHLLRAVLIALAVAFVMALLALIAGRRLAAPIAEMSAQARRFADGDYSARVTVAPSREMAELGNAFNDLAERVGSLVTSLAERSRELEADIKERERLETELLHARQLEAVGRLAGGVAHDFNNLLTVVLANLSFMEEALDPGSPLLAEVHAARDAATRGAALTSQLLAFSRQGVIEARVINFGKTLRGLETLLRRLVGDHVVLTVEPEEGLWPVLLDPTQSNQVVMNLAANARDAMPRGGSLRISAHNVHSDNEALGLPPGDYVELRVRDTGQGMSPDTVARAFEPFFTTKEVGRGTGLGLATVYGIVTRAGGSVHIESVPGEGTTFFIRLPRANTEPITDPRDATPAMQRRGGTETVLLVEDDVLVRASISRQLRDLGYRVIESHDGVEALDHLAQTDGQIRLVVSDVLMPRLDGWSLSRQLRETHPHLPVLLLSGNAPDEVAELHQTGEFLAKPFSADEFAQRVRTLIDRPAHN